jgi:HEAT repeat protein
VSPHLLVVGAAIVVVFGLAIISAGVALGLRGRNTRRARRRGELEARWRPLVHRALEGHPESLTTLDLAPSEKLFLVEFLSQYAARVRGRERELLRMAAAPFLTPLSDRLKGGRDPVRRARAARALGLLGGEESIPELAVALGDRSPLVAMTAARMLFLRQRPEFIRLVFERPEPFGDWSPRYFASTLSDAGAEGAGALRQILAHTDRPSWMRGVAADALAELNDLRSAAVAASTLEHAQDSDLQCACLRLLERVGGPREAGHARTLFFSPEPVVRICAISALGMLGGEEDLPRLREALTSPEPWISINAAHALRRLEGGSWLATFTDDDESVALAAAGAHGGGTG